MLNMNKAFFLRTEDRDPKWRVIDAKGLRIGRVATLIADALRGKDKAYFTPHVDCGDYIVVINSQDMVFTGNKMKDKVYEKYTGFIGNKQYLRAEQIHEKDPRRLIEMAVKGMLPKESALSRSLLRKLKVYAGGDHPHKAQVAETANKNKAAKVTEVIKAAKPKATKKAA